MSDTTLKPGRLSNFSASMAEAMDNAFQKEWQAVKGTELSNLGAEDRKILMVAIAQGVVTHLQKHAGAIQVLVNEVEHTGTATDIQTEGLMEDLTT